LRFFLGLFWLLSLSFSFARAEELEVPFEITGTFSILNPSDLVLSSREYQVSYSKNFLGVSAFQLGMSLPYQTAGAFYLFPFAKIGYARNQGTYSITASKGETQLSEVTLHWAPLSAGLRTEYSIPGFNLIRPFFILSTGAEWLTQRGDTPGLSESFWIPFYNAGLGFSFFDLPSRGMMESELGFKGFSFSMNLQNSLTDSQEARTISYDLTVHFFL